MRSYRYARLQLFHHREEAVSLNTPKQIPLHVAIHHLFHWNPHSWVWSDDLIDLIADLLEIFPAGVGVRDMRGDTPLLIACEALERTSRYGIGQESTMSEEMEITLDIFANMLDAFPQAASIPSESGKLPLQFLLQNWSTPLWLVQKLARLHPQAILQVSPGGGYHHPLIDYCRFEETLPRIRTLVEINPQAALSVDHRMPLHLTLAGYVWDTICDEMWRRQGRESIQRRPRHAALSSAEIESITSSMDEWKPFTDLLFFLLKAAYHGTTGELPDGQVFRALHAACSFDSPCDLVCFLARLHPEQLMQPDEQHGWLPLHIAASNGKNSEYGEKVLKLLTQLCPGAAMTLDSHQRLPLHLALERNAEWKDGVSSLVETAPRSLRVRDGKTGLYPLLLAASSSGRPGHEIVSLGRGSELGFPMYEYALAPRERDDWLTTIYKVLQADPTIVRRAASR